MQQLCTSPFSTLSLKNSVCRRLKTTNVSFHSIPNIAIESLLNIDILFWGKKYQLKSKKNAIKFKTIHFQISIQVKPFEIILVLSALTCFQRVLKITNCNEVRSIFSQYMIDYLFFNSYSCIDLRTLWKRTLNTMEFSTICSSVRCCLTDIYKIFHDSMYCRQRNIRWLSDT